MRPANLIPPDERSASGSGLRAAPVAYAIVAALLLAIGGLALLMTTNNRIADEKAEIAVAKRQTVKAEAQAAKLASYTTFDAAAAARKLAVTNLANSRFDWAKVLRQLALVAPPDVWLSSLGGSVRNGVSVGGAESSALRNEIPGPALSLNGCALSPRAVANYITELKEIEGVTRVGLSLTSQSNEEEGGESGSGSEGSSDCGGGNSSFEAVAAFDAAPIPTDLAAEGLEEAPPVEEAAAEGEAEGAETTEGAESPEGE